LCAVARDRLRAGATWCLLLHSGSRFVFHQPTKTVLFGGRTAPTGSGTITAFCCCQCPPSAGACASLCSTFSCKGSD
jgi:hypothetical protein